jgi:hypothetical protein
MSFWLVRPEENPKYPRINHGNYMRIIEILSAISDQEININDPHTLTIRTGDQHMMQRTANAFTTNGAVKRRRTQNHPRGPLHQCPMQLPWRFHLLA